LFFQIVNRQAIHQNAHVFPQRALIIQNISLQPGIRRKHMSQNFTHGFAIALYRRTIDMTSQVRCKMDFDHSPLYHRRRVFKVSNNKLKRRHFLAFALLPAVAFAHSSKLGEINIGHSWALPTTSTEAQVMMPLFNGGTSSDRLLSARTAIASSIELRNAGVIVSEFQLDPGKPFPMRAAANHLHLLGLAKPLAKGDQFPLTLTFKTAGEIEIQIHVAEKPGE
jgi:periplasmic copper chaperone A